MKFRFPHYKQLDQMDCGPTCIRIIAKHYGKSISLQHLREKAYINRTGVSMSGLAASLESIGMRSVAVEASYGALCEEATLPCIAFWRQNHFIVIYKIKNDIIYVSDPGHGLIKYKKREFLKHWISSKDEGEDTGILMLLEPTPTFYELEEEEFGANNATKVGFSYLYKYFFPYKKYLWQLLFGLIAGSVMSLITPFLTQSLVDYGVINQNVKFVYVILIAQLTLFVGNAFIEIIRKWILLTLSIRINISLVSNFISKLMRLSLGFHDSKNIGDIQSRILDHSRIEQFLTTQSIDVIFSLFNIVIFGTVLAIYDLNILLVYLFGAVLYVAWILIFLKKRKEIDYKLFNQRSANATTEIELIRGMQEIKLNNCELEKRWNWEGIQAQLFKIKQQSLAWEQYQVIGANLINQFTNLIISFIAATAVIQGDITLGMMMAITFITGQLNAPIQKMVGLIQAGQDANLSLERIGEIHDKEDEDSTLDQPYMVPDTEDIHIKNLDFRYGDPVSPLVLDNINITIPRGKTTAIVGASGSGKTTLVKLLLKFYTPVSGDIAIGNTSLSNISGKDWRDRCGAVMQDGYIFAESIARNIAIKGTKIDKKRLLMASGMACIKDFVEALPMNYNTKLGLTGVSTSGGERQRILIARAIYKDPDFLFFDEATSSLDAKNEMEITRNLEKVTKNKTNVIVAHRLSTVKNADQIVVLDKGKVVEEGTHQQLTNIKGIYFNLVKNQLELGN